MDATVAASVYGAITSSVILAATTIYVARYLQQEIPRRLTKVSLVRTFSQRFQELMNAKHELNTEFSFGPDGEPKSPAGAATSLDRANAWNLYRQFFDLFANEFNYFEEGLETGEVYTEWAKWRWYSWDPTRHTRPNAEVAESGFSICAISYREAWAQYSERDVTRNSAFVSFLDGIHRGPKNEDDVRRWVLGWNKEKHRFGWSLRRELRQRLLS